METGVAIFPTPDAIDPGSLARLVEERGHESLFFPEHTRVPSGRPDPRSGDGGPSFREGRAHDLFVAVTAAVVATTRLRVGSGVCLVVERDPVTTAREVARVDRLSGGRFEFGVGAGWNRGEPSDHGADTRRRMVVMRERIETMKAIWTRDGVGCAGERVAAGTVRSWPRPAQRPHPPVLVGGNGPTVLDRVLAFGDAWLPNYAEGVLDRAERLRARAERHVDLVVMGIPADPRALERFGRAGFRRAVHWLPSAGRGPVERALDRFEAAMAQVRGG